METSAAKRRKTNLRSSVSIDNNESTTPPDPPPERASRSKRASYASPTKASLSRHNPDILERRLASPNKSFKNGAVPDEAEEASALAVQQLRGEEKAHVSSSRGTLDTATVAEPAASDINNSRRWPSRQIGGALASRPRRSPIKPKPRPLPPPGPEEDDEEITNPFSRHPGLRRSPPHGREEPDLPPTPEHPDPVVSTPPTGLHSTPTKRPRRSRALAEKIQSSPTKQRLAQSTAAALRKDQAPAKSAPIRQRSPQKEGRRTPQVSDVRGVLSFDPDSDKKRQRDALLADIAQLESDLYILAAENERHRQAHLSRVEASAPQNRTELLEVLGRHVPLEFAEKPRRNDPSTNLLQAALNPIAFLPFGKASPSSLPSLVASAADEEDKEPDLTSHHPVAMGAEEALPYLQVFTPLTFTSSITVLTPDGPDAPLLQRHSITAVSSATGAPGLFGARIEMTVDTSTHAITDLAVPRLEPAAVAELSPFVEAIVAGGNGSSAMTRNVGLLGWAMGEWVRVALRRARVWRTLAADLGTEEALLESMRRFKARGKGKRVARTMDDGDDANRGTEDDGVTDVTGNSADTSDLLPYLGQMAMDFRILASPGGGPGAEASTLRVQWRIEFDWTGEARSRIGVLVGMPGKWHHDDDRDHLAGIPALFDGLMQSRDDPVAAVRSIVGLLVGDLR